MNAGAPLDRVLHEVEVPPRLPDKPYLKPVYDDPQFLVRNVWRLYGGWYDGEPDNLLPAPRAEQAGVGRPPRAASTASWPVQESCGTPATCGWLATSSRWPSSPSQTRAAHQLRAAVYAGAAAVSSMERNILNHAALSSRDGRRDLQGNG